VLQPDTSTKHCDTVSQTNATPVPVPYHEVFSFHILHTKTQRLFVINITLVVALHRAKHLLVTLKRVLHLTFFRIALVWLVLLHLRAVIGGGRSGSRLRVIRWWRRHRVRSRVHRATGALIAHSCQINQ